MNTVQTLAAPLGRVLLALIFVMSGIGKITGYAATQGYMEAMGVPGILLPLVIALEVAGGIAIIVGWKTRLAAFALAGFSILSALLFHANFNDQTQMIMFMKNFAIAGGFLLLVAQGASSYALDSRMERQVEA
jgi:putative oxidoreductase